MNGVTVAEQEITMQPSHQMLSRHIGIGTTDADVPEAHRYA